MIKIFPSTTSLEPLEVVKYKGGLVDFLESQGFVSARHFHLAQVSINGRLISVDEYDGVRIKKSDEVEIRVSQAGAIGKIIGKVFNTFFGWLMPKAASATARDYGQGKQLSAAEGKANVARLNENVPEQYGRFAFYPSYLVPPRRQFTDPRKQQLEMLLCQGEGEYDIHSIEIGNTPISELDGASVVVYQPNADLSAETCAENWYSAPEVGGTSAGTAGLDLSSVADTSITPTGTSFTFNGNTITSTEDFPDSWGSGTVFSVSVLQTVTLSEESIGLEEYTGFSGSWQDLQLSVGTQVDCIGVFEGRAQVAAISGNVVLLERNTGSGLTPVRLPTSTGAAAFGMAIPNRKYTVNGVAGNTAIVDNAYGGWDSLSGLPTWDVDESTIYGESAGPFVICPRNERTQTIEVDFYFPQGLYGNDLSNRSVTVVISYRDSYTSSPWQSVTKTYTAKTLDQIGFTERIILPGSWLPEVRVQRKGARSTSGNAQDIIQWYGARSLLPTPTRYQNWTTIAVRIQGLGQISASSENQVKVTSTRKINGVATRRISDAFIHILEKASYPLDNVDLVALNQLESVYWTPRGETFDAVIQSGTLKQVLDQILSAGMAEFTEQDGVITPIRKGVRTIAQDTLVFSAQTNTDFSRTFTSARHDDHDGVEVEYQDEDMGYVSNTVIAKLPDSLGIKLEKIKLVGVTNKDRAYRIGMRLAGEQRYQRWTYSWGTELDLLAASYGSYVLLCPEIPSMGQSSLVAGYTDGVLVLYEDLTWVQGRQHVFGYMKKDGSITGIHTAQRGASDSQIITTASPPGDVEEPSIIFGTAERFSFPAIVSKITPSSDFKVKAEAVNYDARVYEYDNATAS